MEQWGWFDRLLGGKLRPRFATAAAVLLVVGITVAFQPVDHRLTTATKALCLVIPVMVAAVLGGRSASYVAAASSAVAFGFLVPPYRSVRVAVTQDLIALGVFGVVAIAAGSVVARRIELLGELDRQRALVLQSVAHDLRTPLAVIIAASTGLRSNTPYSPAGRDHMLDLVTGEAIRLDRLVSNLLDLSRLESGALRLDRDAIDLAALANTCADRLRTILPEIEVTVTVAADVPHVDGDVVLLDQLLTNLLDNAARHGGGTVRLDISATTSEVSLRVADNGPGIPQDRVAAIFEPFRAGGAGARSGVGLAICRAVANAHGGSIHAEVPAGGGALLRVQLPIANGRRRS